MTNEKIQELADCLISKSCELNEDELEQVSGGFVDRGQFLKLQLPHCPPPVDSSLPGLKPDPRKYLSIC